MLSLWTVALGFTITWILKHVIVYMRDIQRIAIPGYRGLGPGRSLLSGFMHLKKLQIAENRYIWRRKHGEYQGYGWDIISSIYWFGSKPRFYIADARVIKQIGMSRSFQKPMKAAEPFAVFGQSVMSTEGTEWNRHRKVTSRAFTTHNMQLVWEQTVLTVKDMFASDWSPRGDVVVLENTLRTTEELAMSTIMSAGFGYRESWQANSKPPSGHTLTLSKALHHSSFGVVTKLGWPRWVWGSQASRDSWAVAGIAGRGWLGERVQHTAVVFSELAKYMQRMLQEELAGGQVQTYGRERGNLFGNLVSALGDDANGKALSRDDVFGNMFIFLLASFSTSAQALAYTFGLLALNEDEQQRLYDHIQDVLQDQEPTFEDATRLTRVLAVFLETLRLYPGSPSTAKSATEDTIFSVQASVSESEAANLTEKEDTRRKDVFVPKGSEVVFDIGAVHHNPRYWQDPYSFNPDRFLDPNWPRDAFLTFSVGNRSCMGRRFAEVEAIATITMIIRNYKVSIDPARCPDIPGESKLERRERVLKSNVPWGLTPCGIPLVFTRR